MREGGRKSERTVRITGCSSGFGRLTARTFHARYDTNVSGLMNVTRAVLPRMRRQGEGCVINVTSLSGLVGADAELLSVMMEGAETLEALSAPARFYRDHVLSVRTLLYFL